MSPLLPRAAGLWLALAAAFPAPAAGQEAAPAQPPAESVPPAAEAAPAAGAEPAPALPPAESASPAAEGAPAAKTPAPALEREAGTVPVRFEAGSQTDRFTVRVDEPGGASCETPCSMSLHPGEHRVRITGEGRFSQPMEVWSPGGTVRVFRHDGGWLAMGVVALSVGAVTAQAGVIGAALLWSETRQQLARDLSLGVAVSGLALAIAGPILAFGRTGSNHLELSQQPPARPLAWLGFEGAILVPLRQGMVVGARFGLRP